MSNTGGRRTNSECAKIKRHKNSVKERRAEESLLGNYGEVMCVRHEHHVTTSNTNFRNHAINGIKCDFIDPTWCNNKVTGPTDCTPDIWTYQTIQAFSLQCGS